MSALSLGIYMTDHKNTIAETAPVKVRFKHAGVADEEGIHRPVCRPRDLKLQTVKHEKDVTCPHCIEAIAEFKNWMALQIAAGKVPEDELTLEEKAWAILNRDSKATLEAICAETNALPNMALAAVSKLVIKGSVVLKEGVYHKLVAKP